MAKDRLWVLLVDDDAGILKVLAQSLEHEGFYVARAADGEAALELYRRWGSDFDWVITDHQMPRKRGVDLLLEVRAINPTQKCVLMSASLPSLPQPMLAGCQVLSKPFRTSELIEAMRGLSQGT